MLACVKGVFKEGKVELFEIPPGVSESNVVVTFLEPPAKPVGRMMQRGILKGLLDDTESQHAEFNGDRILEKWDRANRPE